MPSRPGARRRSRRAAERLPPTRELRTRSPERSLLEATPEEEEQEQEQQEQEEELANEDASAQSEQKDDEQKQDEHSSLLEVADERS